MLRILHLTLSNRRAWVNVSFATERIRTVPSSQPSAREVHDGLAAIDQIEPPWEEIDLYKRALETFKDDSRLRRLTRMHPLSMSHSTSSVPPPELNRRS